MKLTWLGHSCFAVESGGYRVVLDPYYVESYPPLHTSANEVLCSHHHRDHDYVDAVELTPRGGSPFTVETVQAFHDDQGGALRGTNTIHILAAEGLRVVHLGDLGHELSEEQLAPLRSAADSRRRLLHHRRGDRQARGGCHRAACDRADALPPRQPRLRCDRHGGGLPAALSHRRGTLS